EATARLYPIQVDVAAAQGCLEHLLTVEMPWVITNSRMTWDGVRVDALQCQELLEACRRHRAILSTQLGELGLANAQSPAQLQLFFGRLGLLAAFREGDGYSFDDDRLQTAEERHHSIPLIRALRKIQHLASDPFLNGALTGADGRLHPGHRQLGTET